MKSFAYAIIIILIFSVTSSPVFPLEKKPITTVDANQMTEETQTMAAGGKGQMNLIWWIPVEFWQATFANDESISDSEKNKRRRGNREPIRLTSQFPVRPQALSKWQASSHILEILSLDWKKTRKLVLRRKCCYDDIVDSVYFKI